MEIFIIHVAVVLCCLSEGHSSGKNSVLCIFTELLHLSRNSQFSKYKLINLCSP